MKKNILTLVATTFLLITNSCSKSKNDEVVATNTCSSVSSLNVIQQSDLLLFTIVSTSSPLYYQVSYQSASSSPNPDYGNTFIMNSLSQSKTPDELSMGTGGTYIFYARAVCTDGSLSNWSSPKVVTISSFCSRPSNVNYNGGGNYLSWTNSTGTNTNCQIQYGIHGFTLGNGTTVSITNDYCSGFIMNGNTSYDFYVRSYCSTSQLWSPWSDVYTYLNSTSVCNLPTNLSHQIESTTSTTAYVSLHWSYNGGTNFEYVVVPHGNSISTGTIYTASTSGWPVMILTRSYTYDFYMRTVCSDGSKTSWTSAYLISNL